MASISPPGVRFYRVIEAAPAPVRADRVTGGTLPVRAARHCDAVTTASAYGWWLFSPLDLSLLWDGERVFWSRPAHDGWLELDAAQYPGLRPAFNVAAPIALEDATPPFLTALPEPGMVQIWTGYFARSAPDWSLLVRPPANLGPLPGVAGYEGIVEADRWFAPIFTNLRLTRTDTPVHLRRSRPLVQVQPLPRLAYAQASMDSMQLVPEPAAFTDTDWDDYASTTVPPARTVGQYAIAARKRRHAECPYANG